MGSNLVIPYNPILENQPTTFQPEHNQLDSYTDDFSQLSLQTLNQDTSLVEISDLQTQDLFAATINPTRYPQAP